MRGLEAIVGRQGLCKVICHVRPLGRKAAPSQRNEVWTGDQRSSNEGKAQERLAGLTRP